MKTSFFQENKSSIKKIGPCAVATQRQRSGVSTWLIGGQKQGQKTVTAAWISPVRFCTRMFDVLLYQFAIMFAIILGSYLQ